MWPLRVSAAIASDCTMASTCVTTSTSWRSQRSTQTPASGGMKKRRDLPGEAHRPSRNAESVTR